MAERPRAGLELIALWRAGGQRVELARSRVDGWNLGREVFSQRAFLASPDGEHLVHAAGGELRVLGAGGERVIGRAGGRDARFSADSRRLATTVAVQGAPGELSEVVVIDLAASAAHQTAQQAAGQVANAPVDARRVILGQVHQPRWLEWVRDGVVVSHIDPTSRRAALTYFPLAGSPRQLVSREDLALRFTAAARGSRVMFFAGVEAFVVDVSGGEPTAAGKLPLSPTNMEMSPDGSQAAIATPAQVHRWSAAGLELLESSLSVHTVWYSPDGRDLAYASGAGVVLLTASGQRHELHAPAHDLRAMRFRRGGDGLVVARGDRALLWRPAAGVLRTLATAPGGQQLRGADVYRDGVVLWTLDTQVAPPPARSRRAS
jgi:hypothetical protein